MFSGPAETVAEIYSFSKLCFRVDLTQGCLSIYHCQRSDSQACSGLSSSTSSQGSFIARCGQVSRRNDQYPYLTSVLLTQVRVTCTSQVGTCREKLWSRKCSSCSLFIGILKGISTSRILRAELCFHQLQINPQPFGHMKQTTDSILTCDLTENPPLCPCSSTFRNSFCPHDPMIIVRPSTCL